MKSDLRRAGRTASIDELLSPAFETLPGRKSDADQAALRLASWCRAATGGDWPSFARRLSRDKLTIDEVLARFASIRPSGATPSPAWLEDAVWVEASLLCSDASPRIKARSGTVHFAFEDLLLPLVAQAQARLWESVEAAASACLNDDAKDCLQDLLIEDLCALCAPAFYERFPGIQPKRKPDTTEAAAATQYTRFVADMRADGLRRLLDEKPVLLRLITSTTRQWLETSREFILRLQRDLPVIRRELMGAGEAVAAHIEGHRSDPHHGGRSILIVAFEDGSRVVYKPKDLRLDVAWNGLIERLNGADAPIDLRAMRAVAREGYGWTEHIDHAGLGGNETAARFFRRAGAWLALFHGFAATDMHHENMIAAGEHPVPIDLETLLQAASDALETERVETQAVEAARQTIANSVMAVGLLPAYGRTSDSDIFVAGGVASDWTQGTKLTWSDVNSDAMRPLLADAGIKHTTNLPHTDGDYAKYGDHVDDLVAGFCAYAGFLHAINGAGKTLFEGFAGLAVRRVVRPTQFYYMLLQRLKDDRTMGDGATWSAQVDFLSRLADWDAETDPLWPLQASERAALLALDIPVFVMASDGTDISDHDGLVLPTRMTSGLERARARIHSLDAREIAFQADVIRQNSDFAPRSEIDAPSPIAPVTPRRADPSSPKTSSVFADEADAIADELSEHAIRRGSGAAWIGRGWLRDSDVSQLTVLGPDLYNGACGIALFLAAHAATTGSGASSDLARAALSHLRDNLRGRNAPRLARSLGLGGATGLGSIVYALAAASKLLRDGDLIADAHRAADLMTDDMIAADRQLDVIGGSAGAILGLLRLHRDTRRDEILRRAVKCGEHLLAQPRVGPPGRRSWRVPGPYPGALNGMSHGAAGFALALASLAAAAGREDFAQAASECIAFENASYDASRRNWPDCREAEPHWRSQWCHGAVGIGLARLAMLKTDLCAGAMSDIEDACAGAEIAWPAHADSLCCGTLGGIELMFEAGEALDRRALRDGAEDRLRSVLHDASVRGDYRWNGGGRRFNLGLFRGLAGVGYTCLRRFGSLPNVLVWE